MTAEPWDDWAEREDHWTPWLDPTTTRDVLAAEVERSSAGFMETASGLPADLVARPGSIGSWSVHDCIAHCLVWCEYAQAVLQSSIDGTFSAGEFEYGEMDAYNERTAAERRETPTSELLLGIARSARTVAALLRRLPEEEWSSRDRYRLVVIGAITDHLPEHRAEFEELARA